MHRRILQFFILFCFVAVAWVSPAGARPLDQASCTCTGTYPPSPLSLDLVLQPTAGLAGTVVTVSGHACSGGATLTVLFDDPVLGTTTADPSGAFSTTVTIPVGAEAGAHRMTVSGAGCPESATFMVLPAIVKGNIAFTGGNIYGLLQVAAGLGLLGAVLVVVTRRRRAANRLIES